jgi:hypothetical protein
MTHAIDEPKDIDYFKFKEALEKLRSSLDDRKMCCVYLGGDYREPCNYTSRYMKIQIDKFEKEVLDGD